MFKIAPSTLEKGNKTLKKKGLGKELGAILGNAAIEPNPNDFEYLPLHRIEPSQEQPRTIFEQEQIDELADSIREHGVLSPLTVRSVDDSYYQIIAGERRWRAARAAGLVEVPARIVVADDKLALELAMIENLQREDLSPIEEARGYKALMDEFGMTQERIAQRVSKSRPAVANALRLLSLPEPLANLVLAGKLPAGSARALLALKDEEMMIAAATLAIDGEMSTREVEALVKKLNREKTSSPKKHKTNVPEVDYLLDVRDQLTKALGRRINIKQGRKKGKIEIEYYDLDDFNVLFEALLSHTPSERNDNTQ